MGVLFPVVGKCFSTVIFSEASVYLIMINLIGWKVSTS